MTQAVTSEKSNRLSSRFRRISATTMSTGASGLTLRLPVTSPTSSRRKPHSTARSCISWNFCSVSAIRGVV